MSISNKSISIAILIIVHLTNFINSVELSQSTSEDQSKDRLTFAHVICRHGDKNIVHSYPNDPYKDELNWPGGFGELTDVGMRQHYELGKYLRRRYASLLGNGSYSPDIVYVESTRFNRAINSAYANLAGLFLSENNEMWNGSSDSQRIFVHPISEEKDHRLDLTKNGCARYDQLYSDYIHSSQYTEWIEQHRPLINYIETNTGVENSATPFHSIMLYDILLTEKRSGKRLPSWTDKIMFPGSDFERFGFSWYTSITPTTEMKKITYGYLLKEILDHFTNKTQSTLSPNRTLWMFFGHDFNLALMLDTLGIFWLHQPPLASCLFFELYDGGDSPYVQIFYKNTTETNIPPLDIPGCGKKCPLTELYHLYENVLPNKSYEDDCTLRDDVFSIASNTRNGLLSFLGPVIATFMCFFCKSVFDIKSFNGPHI